MPHLSSPILQSRSGKEWRCFYRRHFVLSISLPQLNNSQTHLPGTKLEIYIYSVLIFCFYVGLHLFCQTREIVEFCCKYFFHRVPVLLEFWDRDKTKSQNVLIGASQLNLSDTLAMEQTRAVVSMGMELSSNLLINGASYNRHSIWKFVWEKAKTQGASYIGVFGVTMWNTKSNIRVLTVSDNGWSCGRTIFQGSWDIKISKTSSRLDHNGCNHLSMLGLKVIYVIKRGPLSHPTENCSAWCHTPCHSLWVVVNIICQLWNHILVVYNKWDVT